MKKAAENQMCSFSVIKDYFLHVVVFALMLIFTFYFNSLISSILLSCTIFIISIVLLFTINKRKIEVYQVKDEVLGEVVEVPKPENEVFAPLQEPKEVEVSKIHDYVVQSQELSESESVDLSSTSEDSDVDWAFQIPTCSDDSISDDDSLIEIALPEGHYISPKEDFISMSPKKLPELFPESLFRQESLLELLAEINEMNEEDNLIEIDISIGSIKCSRLEIEA